MQFRFNPLGGSNTWRRKFAWLPKEIAPCEFIWLESYEMRRPVDGLDDVALFEQRRRVGFVQVFEINLAPAYG